MDIKRIILYSALALVVYSLWTNWQKDYPPVATSLSQNQPLVVNEEDERSVPNLVTEKSDNQSTTNAIMTSAQEQTKSKTIHVVTDVLDLTIDLKHGDIIKAQLLQYPENIKEKNIPFSLLQNNDSGRYVANSNLFRVKDQSIETIAVNFKTKESNYRLSPGQDKLSVTLIGETENGLQVEKTFELAKESYLIDVSYKLTNDTNAAWKGYVNNQLVRTNPKEEKSSMFSIGSYTGASYSNPGHHRYQKVSFKDMSKANLDVDVNGGWIAMQQHYFLSAWIPNSENTGRFYTRSSNNNFTIGVVSNPIILSSQQSKVVSSQLYVGPEDGSVLKSISPGLDLTIDYGWLWFFSSLLFSLMKTIYSVVGNWGWSIVLVTVLVKLAFYKLSATSYKSMANMRKLQPKLTALRERFGDDKAKLSQATMELYRNEKVNPLGGCLPIVVQIPVFIALYWVLIESVELRQAPFIFWINDLAAPDPFHILPIIMGATMLIQQRLNPAPPDPTQAKVMMFLPVLFTALFWNFPSGLVLYWVVNNSLSILQQWYITRKYSGDQSTKKLVAAK